MARETWVWDGDLKKFLTKQEYLDRDRPAKRSSVKVRPVERGSWVFDRDTGKLIPRHLRATSRAKKVQIIRDIEAYKPVAADKGTGKRPIIGGRRQHREFLQRNGYIEVGNETPKTNLQLGPRPGEVARDIRRALGE